MTGVTDADGNNPGYADMRLMGQTWLTISPEKRNVALESRINGAEATIRVCGRRDPPEEPLTMRPRPWRLSGPRAVATRVGSRTEDDAKSRPVADRPTGRLDDNS
jgi:hypothetical protein